jgi:hypothetical protein
MTQRATLPLLCAAALTLAAVPGLARVGVVVGIAPPAPVVEAVPAPPGRYGSPEPGSGMAPAECGSLAIGGTGGGEVG